VRSIPLAKLAVVVRRLETAEAVADHFGCSLDAAKRMVKAAMIADPDALPKSEAEEIKPLPAPKVLPNFNPAFDPLEWSYEREKIMMRRGSHQLLLAMLESGQHYLRPEVAEQLLHKLRK
jgi:hypothetical protein